MTAMNAKEYSSFKLARLAGCSDPDEHDGMGFGTQDVEPREGSAGARFLRGIAYSVEEYLNEEDNDLDDMTHEIADGAVPVYTHEMWKTFVDLGAYQEDPSEIGYDDTSNMDGLAGACLYLIASRLVSALGEAETDDDES